MKDKNDQNAWKNFYQTGRVEDYLACRGISLNSDIKASENLSEGKNTHRRTGDKRKSYR